MIYTYVRAQVLLAQSHDGWLGRWWITFVGHPWLSVEQKAAYVIRRAFGGLRRCNTSRFRCIVGEEIPLQPVLSNTHICFNLSLPNTHLFPHVSFKYTSVSTCPFQIQQSIPNNELHLSASERLPFGLKWREGRRSQRMVSSSRGKVEYADLQFRLYRVARGNQYV